MGEDSLRPGILCREIRFPSKPSSQESKKGKIRPPPPKPQKKIKKIQGKKHLIVEINHGDKASLSKRKLLTFAKTAAAIRRPRRAPTAIRSPTVVFQTETLRHAVTRKATVPTDDAGHGRGRLRWSRVGLLEDLIHLGDGIQNPSIFLLRQKSELIGLTTASCKYRQ